MGGEGGVVGSSWVPFRFGIAIGHAWCAVLDVWRAHTPIEPVLEHIDCTVDSPES